MSQSHELFPTSPKRQRTTSARNTVTIYIRDTGVDWIEDLMEAHDVNRSEVVKGALAFAALHQSEFDTYLKERNA